MEVVGIAKVGGHFNFTGSIELSEGFETLKDALEWADFIGFTHYTHNGATKRIPKALRMPEGTANPTLYYW